MTVRFIAASLFRSVPWSRVWHMILVFVTTVGMGLLGSPSVAIGQSIQLTVHPKSQFWIQGRATTHTFTCEVNQVEGRATLVADQDSGSASTQESGTNVVVEVPVKAFDCGRDGMTRDLQETLKMNDHPRISFELVHATVTGRADSSEQWRRIEVLGTLTIAGTKRLTRFHVVARSLGNDDFRVRGCHPIRMTYYNIEPPTKALGLIKVKNRVEVQFDLLAHSPENGSLSPFDSVTISEAPTCDDE